MWGSVLIYVLPLKVKNTLHYRVGHFSSGVMTLCNDVLMLILKIYVYVHVFQLFVIEHI